jgi:Xaa-Pro aminopeptidase
MSRTPSFDMQIFKKRREKLAPHLTESALVIFSNPEFLRNHDSNYEYRQDTNFFYVTGFEEPESVCVFRPGQKPEYILFVRPKDPLRETWDGFRYGPDGAKKYYGADEVHLISDLSKKLPELLKSVKSVFFRLNQQPQYDQVMLKAIDDAKMLYGRSGRSNLDIIDSANFLGEFRIIKDATEIEWQKKACEITAKAHTETMKFVEPGLNERQVDAYIQYQFKFNMAPRMGYNTIVASGHNATTLHYNFNDQPCKSGDLLLIDAGAEYNYFSGDITRTFPVNGKFTAIQKEFYNLVLKVQKEMVAFVKPGIQHKSLQDRTIELLTEAMLELKLLKGSRDENIRNMAYKKYYPHGVSHWLGMDVHDAGLYQINGESRMLEPGMVFSIEPGLYVPHDDQDAAKDLRGLGVRIEDDILVTAKGHENMTALAPKEVSEIESVMS